MATPSKEHQTFSEHLLELRQRFFWSAIFLIAASIVGYYLRDLLLGFLVSPLNQTIYYTSPTGGFELIFKTSLLFGIIVTSPILTYHVLKFIQPSLPNEDNSIRLIFECMIASFLLTLIGIKLAYVYGLPATLKILNEFSTSNIESMITTQEYFTFVITYLGGFAFFFQLPLIMLLVHFIVPQKPKMLLRYIRYVILISFILAAILTPTGDPVNQIIMALPMVMLYLFAIGIIALTYIF